MKIYVCTTNSGKVKEIASLLSPIGFQIELASASIEETGTTLEENAKIKSTSYSLLHPKELVLAEDSGLVLEGLTIPGVHSSNFFELDLETGTLPANAVEERNPVIDLKNNERLIEFLKKQNKTHWPAQFQSVISLARDGVEIISFKGTASGHIQSEMKGTGGFGYDPLFVGLDTFGYTYAEIDSQRKNLKSHRRKALNLLFDYFAKSIISGQSI